MTDTLGIVWHAAELTALDLEGSGAQDREAEAVLEIATVPLAAGQPVLTEAYTTLINPGRTIPRRPWISPGLRNADLAQAPSLGEVEPELAARINGRYLVGHNIGVDWRLLHRRCPSIQPAGLIDTLRLARPLKLGARNSLTTLLDHFGLTEQVAAAALHSQPHRALWDTTAAAMLLPILIRRTWKEPPSLAELSRVAALAVGSQNVGTPVPEVDFLF